MRRRSVVLLVLGTCILSAAIGSGITLLAKTGPQGPPGPPGPRGLQGSAANEYEAERAVQEVQDVEATVRDLERETEELRTEEGFLESEIADVGSQEGDNARAIRELCFALEFTGCP